MLKLSHHPHKIAVDAERSPWRGSGFKNRFVGRLTCSLPLSHPDGRPVCVARIPAAPLCETLIDVRQAGV
jgi:hypothetical protein